MEEKKSTKANLQKKRIVYFEIGLAAALLITITLFAHNKRKTAGSEIENPVLTDAGAIEIIPVTRQPEQSSAHRRYQFNSDVISIVKDDWVIENEIDFTDDFSRNDIFVAYSSEVAGMPNIGSGIDDGEVFIKVEHNPKFQGQDPSATFPAWVAKNVTYPEKARRNRVEGRVMVEFVIEKDGTLSNITVLSSPDQSLSDAAVDAIKKSPKWTPGRQRSKAVRVLFQIPVNFRLK